MIIISLTAAHQTDEKSILNITDSQGSNSVSVPTTDFEIVKSKSGHPELIGAVFGFEGGYGQPIC